MNNGKDTPFRRPVASFRSATASGQKEMTYGGCARPSEVVDSAVEEKERTREGPCERGKEGWEGDKKRTTVVRGYRELHNSWPSHNRAAQGCERADGMSFSFVSSRGDYFSFHSFVSCRDSSLSLSLQLFYLCVPRTGSFLTIIRIPRVLFIRPTTLSFAHAVRPRFILEP